MEESSLKLLKAVPILSDMSDDVLKRLSKDSKMSSYKRNTIIWHKGDENTGLHVLLSGMAKVVEYTKDGREFILNIMVPADCMGEMSLLEKNMHTSDLIAMEDCDILLIPSDTFNRISRENPQLIDTLVQNVTNRLEMLTERASALKHTDVYGRIYSLISGLISRKVAKKGYLKLNDEEIAKLIGASTEDVSPALVEMQNKGLIRFENNRIHITGKFD